MPSFNCKHPTCNVILAEKGFCPAHATAGLTASVTSSYDRYQRDPESKRFYSSARWQRTRAVKLAHSPLCESPGCRQLAEHVHHIKPVKQIRLTEPHLLFAAVNLKSLCAPCHTRIEKTCSI